MKSKSQIQSGSKSVAWIDYSLLAICIAGLLQLLFGPYLFDAGHYLRMIKLDLFTIYGAVGIGMLAKIVAERRKNNCGDPGRLHDGSNVNDN